MSWYIAAALLIIAGLYFDASWVIYLGLVMLFAPLIIAIATILIILIAAVLDSWW